MFERLQLYQRGTTISHPIYMIREFGNCGIFGRTAVLYGDRCMNLRSIYKL
jgi:hypothetical protein